MTAETSPSYISDLNAAYPEANSAISLGDDNIRNIKTVLKTTFTGGSTGLSGAVTASHTELNLLDTAVAGTIVNSKAVIYGAAGEVNATTLQIAGTSITASAAELNLLDNAVADTVVNSKAVIYSSAGRVKATTLDVAGNITLSAATSFIKGDFSDAVLNDRVWFQSSVLSGNTSIGAVPATGATQSQFLATNAFDLPGGEGSGNMGYAGFGINETNAYVSTSITGSGTAVPLVFATGSTATTRMTISTAGDVSLSGDQIGIDNSQTPSGKTATGVKGTICWDADYIYVCVDTNTWKRVAISDSGW